jgi:hypothetical protein
VSRENNTFFADLCFHTFMHTDFSVELGAEDDCLELPWASPDGTQRYYDLRRQPELLLNVQEAFENEELGHFLASINSPGSILESCKCDVWTTRELNEEELIYGAGCKWASYIDLVFTQPEPRYSFEQHEELVRAICGLLKRVPEISSAAEFIIRRCYFTAAPEEKQEGLGITFYLSGYGEDEDAARSHWNIGLRLVENALLQISAAQRKS